MTNQNKQNIRIWVDKNHSAPDLRWVHVQTPEDFKKAVKRYRNHISEISFNNQLGSSLTGYDLLLWLLKNTTIQPYQINLHSPDVSAVHKMQKALEIAQQQQRLPKVKITTYSKTQLMSKYFIA